MSRLPATAVPPADDLRTDERQLLDAVRAGSSAAFSVLYDRHRVSSLRYARRLLNDDSVADPEDIVELAFVRSLSALRNGHGPGDTLRYYLLASIRHEVWRVESRQRKEAVALDRWSTDGTARAAKEAQLIEGAVAGLGPHLLMAGVFRDLPERWRTVLWLTEVEGRDSSEVAPILGMSPNSVSALAYRARHGLRVAFIGAHQQQGAPTACQAIAPRLAAYLASRNRSGGDFEDLVVHLEGCTGCRNLVRGVDDPGDAPAPSRSG